VYGGGTRGIMGIISDSVLQHGGSVVAVVPDAMLRAGGEGEQRSTWGPIGHEELEEKGRDKVSTVCDRRYRDKRVMSYICLIDQRSNL
jgi:predicted Rossmann-fold nucleotide-binding protein